MDTVLCVQYEWDLNFYLPPYGSARIQHGPIDFYGWPMTEILRPCSQGLTLVACIIICVLPQRSIIWIHEHIRYIRLVLLPVATSKSSAFIFYIAAWTLVAMSNEALSSLRQCWRAAQGGILYLRLRVCWCYTDRRQQTGGEGPERQAGEMAHLFPSLATRSLPTCKIIFVGFVSHRGLTFLCATSVGWV